MSNPFCRLMPRDTSRFLIVLCILSILTSKTVHIVDSLSSTPADATWIFFFPTFFVKDISSILLILLALYPQTILYPIRCLVPRPIILLFNMLSTTIMVYSFDDNHDIVKRVGKLVSSAYVVIFGYLLPVVSALAASNEIWIYTYSDMVVIWREVPALIYDPISYGPQLRDLQYGGLLIAWFVMMLVTATLEQIVSKMVRHRLRGGYDRIPRTEEDLLKDQQVEMEDCSSLDGDKEWLLGLESPCKGCHDVQLKLNRRTGLVVTTIVMISVASLFRPLKIYDSMVNSVPFVLLDMFPPCNGDLDASFGSIHTNNLFTLGFPFPEEVALKGPEAYPGTEYLISHLAGHDQIPEGFARFTREREDAWKDWKRKAKKAASGNIDLHLAPSGYHHAFDPLKISNLAKDLLPELTMETPPPTTIGETTPLKNIRIRNILHIVLESTRADVFPLRPDNHYAQMLKRDRNGWDTYDDLNITPWSSNISGFEIGKGGAGLIVHGAETQSSYSLKSHLYHFCGQQALPVGGNKEFTAEFYQPCMPHILKLLSSCNATSADDDWRSYPWTTQYLQTASVNFDNHPALLKLTGFDRRSEILTSETLASSDAKHPVTEPFVNSEGYREAVLNPYLKDLIQTSKKEKKRFYAGVWTISAHWKFTMPHKRWWNARKLADSEQLNNYINAIGFQDEWLASVIELLKEEGVYDETLIVLNGDHGFAQKYDIMPPARQDVPVANPYHKFFQIPLVFHHPKLPTVHLHANATNLSVLPTIIDLLLSSNSSTPNSDPEKVLKSLLPVYEGQSLLRPLQFKTPGDFDDYRFTLPNNGGFLIVGESSDPTIKIRFSVPIAKEFLYTASNRADDPLDMRQIRAWTKEDLLEEAGKRWGEEKKNWISRGITSAKWWKVEMERRWRYGEFAPGKLTN